MEHYKNSVGVVWISTGTIQWCKYGNLVIVLEQVFTYNVMCMLNFLAANHEDEESMEAEEVY